jgi:selenocysteine-specific elongation factor
VRFHHGTVERLGRVALAGSRDGAGAIAEVPAGGAAYARIRLEAPAVLTRGDRFIIRAYSPSITIGGGVVLDPHPPSTAIRTDAGWRRLHRLDGGAAGAEAGDTAVAGFLEERGAAGLLRRTIVSRAGHSAAAADAVAGRLAQTGRAVAIGEWLVAPAALADLSQRLLAVLKAHHAAEPLSDGLPREEARERVFGRAAPVLFEYVLTDLVARRQIVARTTRSNARIARPACRRRMGRRLPRRRGCRPPWPIASGSCCCGRRRS